MVVSESRNEVSEGCIEVTAIKVSLPCIDTTVLSAGNIVRCGVPHV